MNRKIVFTEEHTKDIIEKYQNKAIRVDDILSEYGISSSVLAKIIRENNIPFRRENLCNPRKRSTKKVCHWCKQAVNIPGAKYCPYCGRNIQTEGEIIIDKLTGLFPYGEHIPVNSREEYRLTLNKAIEYIKQEENDDK